MLVYQRVSLAKEVMIVMILVVNLGDNPNYYDIITPPSFNMEAQNEGLV